MYEKKPTAFITVDKQRTKKHATISKGPHSETHTTQLTHNDEFEIELFNPDQRRIKLGITINGISLGSDLILNPGQRVFLERFIPSNEKFKFETYEIDGNDTDAVNAVMLNGVVEVNFYKEMLIDIRQNILHQEYPTGPIYRGMGINGYFDINQTTFNTLLNTTGVTLGNDSITTNITSSVDNKKTLVSGRIGKGSQSNQNFTNTQGDFSSSPYHKVTWKILPKENDVIEFDDIKIYCTECGTKKKKTTFKFCPTCGTKF